MIPKCDAGGPPRTENWRCQLPAGHDGPHEEHLNRWLRVPIIMAASDGYDYRTFGPLTTSEITAVADPDEEC